MAQTDPIDPWAPWDACAPDALGAVFDLPDFAAQCRALLELAPKASARDLSLLPWEEPHAPKEFRAIRDAWALERQTKREQERERDEKSIEETVREQLENAVRTQDLKSANEAIQLLVKLGTAKGLKTAREKDDDFSRLTDRETLMLAALVHKLRGEPLTSNDDQMLAYVALLDQEPNDASVSAEQPVG